MDFSWQHNNWEKHGHGTSQEADQHLTQWVIESLSGVINEDQQFIPTLVTHDTCLIGLHTSDKCEIPAVMHITCDIRGWIAMAGSL